MAQFSGKSAPSLKRLLPTLHLKDTRFYFAIVWMRGRYRRSSAKNGMFCQQVFCRITALFFSQWDTFFMFLRHTHLFTAIPTTIVLRVSALWSVSKDNGGGCEWLTKSCTLWEALHEHEIWVWPALHEFTLIWGTRHNMFHSSSWMFISRKKTMCHNVTAKI